MGLEEEQARLEAKQQPRVCELTLLKAFSGKKRKGIESTLKGSHLSYGPEPTD